MSQKRFFSRHTNLIILVIFGSLIMGLVIWSSLRMLRETPNRQVNIQMPVQGWVAFTFSTDPFPPLPTGVVQFRLTAENTRNVPVDFGPTLNYMAGAVGTETILDSGVAQRNGARYVGGLQFPSPGDYWVRFDVNDETAVEFQVYVEPAQ